MRIAGTQRERMLQDERRDPHIIGRDGSALFSQLAVDSSVMMRCLFIGVEHSNTGFQQKAPEDGLVARPLISDGKSGAQLADYNEGQPDFIGEFHRLDD